jgi:hypothetical protein
MVGWRLSNLASMSASVHVLFDFESSAACSMILNASIPAVCRGHDKMLTHFLAVLALFAYHSGSAIVSQYHLLFPLQRTPGIAFNTLIR